MGTKYASAMGGKARALRMTSEQRSEAARRAAAGRWNGPRPERVAIAIATISRALKARGVHPIMERQWGQIAAFLERV